MEDQCEPRLRLKPQVLIVTAQEWEQAWLSPPTYSIQTEDGGSTDDHESRSLED